MAVYEFTIDGWPAGMDNIHAPHELPDGTARLLTNVDVLDSGKIRSRAGKTLVTPMVGAHSLWYDEHASQGYYVHGTTMYSIDNKLNATPIVTGLMSGREVSYQEVNGEVFWSNGVTTGRLRGGVNTPWGVETPSQPAALTAVTGSMYPGDYMVAYTFVNSYGEEGGSTFPTRATINTGGVLISVQPPVEADVVATRVYMTGANSETLGLVATLPAGTTSKIFSTPVPAGRPLATLLMNKMPAGNIIAHRKGVMYTAVGNTVVHSYPLRYGLYDPAKHFYMFPKPVTVLLATPAGVFVCADKTYFIDGAGTDEPAQRVLFPFGGVAGTGIYFPNNEEAAWFSERGQIVTEGDKATIVTQKHLAPRPATAGKAFFVEHNGARQLISIIDQPGSNSLEYV